MGSGWDFWADDLNFRDEPVEGLAIVIGESAVPGGVLGIEVAGYDGRKRVVEKFSV